MYTIHLVPRAHDARPIDITPVAWWRRPARALQALFVVVVAVPVLWFAGALIGLAVLGSGAAMLVVAAWRAGSAGQLGRRRGEPRRP